jgi:hypothetical protein
MEYVDSGAATPEEFREVVARYGAFQSKTRQKIRDKLARRER